MSLRFGELTYGKGLFVCFLAGFVVRLVPELLAFPHPIGYDTIYYAYVMKSGVILVHWSRFFTSTWLLYALIVPLYGALCVDAFLLLKILVPVLYGLNVAGVYWFAREALNWDEKKGLLAGGFFAFQLASLRISWDLLRNTLGMSVLLFTLPFIKKLDSRRGFACFVFLSLLTVFAHEYAAVTLLVIVLGLVFWRFVKDRGGRMHVQLILAVLPALAVFLLGVYLRMFPIRYRVESNVIGAGDIVYARVGKLFFLVNYLGVHTGGEYYPTYVDLVLHVSVLFALLYLPYLFLVWKGFFRHGILDFWTCLLLIGSFGCLVFPFCALQYWSRWMFMLVYPFTFYAVNGLEKLLGGNCESLDFRKFRFSESKVKGMVLLTVVLGGFYLLSPVMMPNLGGNVSSFPPVGYYFSSAPTVPYEDVDGVVEAMGWLNENMPSDSCVVLHHAFLFWGKLYLDDSHMIVHFMNDVDLAVDTALEHGFTRVFFVWWNQPIRWYGGWYGVSVPDYFVPLENFCRISVFEYVR